MRNTPNPPRPRRLPGARLAAVALAALAAAALASAQPGAPAPWPAAGDLPPIVFVSRQAPGGADARQVPGMGPIVVTGASGGVGSIAVSILAARGYEVIGVSGRTEHHAYLSELGASSVVTPDILALGARPLESVRFGGAIDNVGGDVLAGLTRHVELWGNIACVGMAASPALETTVFPMILRGVSLLGISSANCPMPLRTAIWNRLGGDLKPTHLERIASEDVPLQGVIAACARVLDRQHVGRVLVRLG